MVALHRLTEAVFELKISHRAALTLTSDPQTCAPAFSEEVVAGVDLLFARLRAAGAITATDPAWCRQVYLALLHEVYQLPADSPDLAAPAGDDPVAQVGARADLLARTVLGALGGNASAEA